MITLEKSDTYKISIEKNIMNSNPTFNIISTGKEVLTDDDIRKEQMENNHLDKERYLVINNDKYVGILEFIMMNPKDSKPWLGLLVVDSHYHNNGIGKAIYRFYEQKMAKRNVTEIRLGCLVANHEGLRFWQKQGFEIYQEILFEDKHMYCLEKKIG